jgi:hypothetical protein
MKVQVLDTEYATKAYAVKALTQLFPHAVKRGDRWFNHSSKIWINNRNQIVIDYGK